MARTGEEVLDSIYVKAMIKGLLTARYDQGRIGLLFSTIAAEFQEFEELMDYYQSQNNLITASNELILENLMAPLAQRFEAKQSNVELTFKRVEGVTEDIFIPAGTVVETAEYNPIQYFTSIDATIYEGTDTVKVNATSIEAGTNTMVGKNALTVLNQWAPDFTVDNENPSYGGTDRELIEETRNRALAFRYVMERGTNAALGELFTTLGIPAEKYNIDEFAHGYGTFAVYIDTESQEMVDLVAGSLKQDVLYGIYFTCTKADTITMDCNVAFKVAKQRDLTPTERQKLIHTVNEVLERYLEMNGIGNNVMKNQVIYAVFEGLWYQFPIIDVDLELDVIGLPRDARGNIYLAPNEKLALGRIEVDIMAG